MQSKRKNPKDKKVSPPHPEMNSRNAKFTDKKHMLDKEWNCLVTKDF